MNIVNKLVRDGYIKRKNYSVNLWIKSMYVTETDKDAEKHGMVQNTHGQGAPDIMDTYNTRTTTHNKLHALCGATFTCKSNRPQS